MTVLNFLLRLAEFAVLFVVIIAMLLWLESRRR